MLLQLFENTDPNQILTPELSEIAESMPAHGFDNPTLRAVLIESIESYRRGSLKCKNDPQRIAFLLYARAWVMLRLTKAEAKLGHPEYLNNALGDHLSRYFQRLKNMCEPWFTPIKEYIASAGFENATPNGLLTKLLHYKGEASGGNGMPIPAIRSFRVQPNGFLPAAISRMQEIELEWQRERSAMMTNSGDGSFPSFSSVPDEYIKVRETVAPAIAYPDNIGWYDLSGSTSPEEAKAMGHCATNSRADTLYSLRKIVSFYIGEVGEMVPFAYPTLTAAVRNTGLIELRGRYNSKPKKEDHPYIIDLIKKLGITRLSPSSYRHTDQFLLTDLSEEDQENVRAFMRDRSENTDYSGHEAEWIFFNQEEVPQHVWEEARGEVVRYIENYLNQEVQDTSSGHQFDMKTNETVGEILDVGLHFIASNRNMNNIGPSIAEKAKELLIELQVEYFVDSAAESPKAPDSRGIAQIARDVLPDVIASIRDTRSDDVFLRRLQRLLAEDTSDEVTERIISATMSLGSARINHPAIDDFIEAMLSLYAGVQPNDGSYDYFLEPSAKDASAFNEYAVYRIDADNSFDSIVDSGAEEEDYIGKYWWVYQYSPTTDNLSDRYYVTPNSQDISTTERGKLISAVNQAYEARAIAPERIQTLFEPTFPQMRQYITDPLELLLPYLKRSFKDFRWPQRIIGAD